MAVADDESPGILIGCENYLVMLIIPASLGYNKVSSNRSNCMNIKRFIILSSTLFLTCCSNSESWFGDDKKLELSGERISVLNIANDLQVNPTTQKKNLALASITKNKDWSALDIENGNNFFLKDNLINQYSVSFSSSWDFQLVSMPIIFASTMVAMDAKGKILAYNLQDGQKIWQNDYFYNFEGNSFLSSNYLNGGLYHANGNIYATSGVNVVICINASSGETIWQTNLSGPTRAVPVFDNNRLYIKSIDNKIYALDAKSGKVEWSYLSVSEEVNILSSIAIQPKNALLITYNDSGEVIALNSHNGEEAWASFLPTNSGNVATNKTFYNTQPVVAIDEHMVFVADKEGNLIALESNSGETIWKKNLKISKRFWLCGSLIFAISDNNKLVAIDKTDGDVRWITELTTQEKEEKKPSWTSPIVANSEVITASDNGWVMFFNYETGVLAHKMAIENDVVFSPIIADGDLIIVSDQGSVNYFGN